MQTKHADNEEVQCRAVWLLKALTIESATFTHIIELFIRATQMRECTYSFIWIVEHVF
jgi:hypothetical protein